MWPLSDSAPATRRRASKIRGSAITRHYRVSISNPLLWIVELRHPPPDAIISQLASRL